MNENENPEPLHLKTYSELLEVQQASAFSLSALLNEYHTLAAKVREEEEEEEQLHNRVIDHRHQQLVLEIRMKGLVEHTVQAMRSEQLSIGLVKLWTDRQRAITALDLSSFGYPKAPEEEEVDEEEPDESQDIREAEIIAIRGEEEI